MTFTSIIYFVTFLCFITNCEEPGSLFAAVWTDFCKMHLMNVKMRSYTL